MALQSSNGNGKGNGHHALPTDPVVTIVAPLPELKTFVDLLSREWLPYEARDFFRRLVKAAEDPPRFVPVLAPEPSGVA